MNDVAIRRMADADREAVIDLLWALNRVEAALTDTRSELREDAEACLAYNENQMAGLGGVHLVADHRGAAVAYMALIIDEAPPFVRREWRRHLRVAELVVAEPFRSQGIGRRLLGEAEDFARALDLKHILIGLIADNVSADRLYEASGFRLYGIERLKRLT